MAHVILVLRNHVQYAHARILAVTSCTIDAVIVDVKSAQCTPDPAHSAEGLAPMVFILVCNRWALYKSVGRTLQWRKKMFWSRGRVRLHLVIE
jgi:hypothetical protein